MNKQEEVREGLFLWMGAYGIKEDDMVKAGIELFRFLHSQGVVIQVEREMPVHLVCFDNGTVSLTDDILDNAGYVTVEPLV